MQDFADPESVLDALDDALHKQYEITNDNIRAGDNPHVQFKKNGLFSTVTNGSVISWRHVNLLGEYDFSDEKLEDTVGIRSPKLAA